MAFARTSYARFVAKATTTSRGCLIPDKVPRDDGYVRYSITAGSAKQAFGPEAEKKEKTFYLHHLAWYVHGNKMPAPVTEHLSHLCSDARCFNVAHMVVETPKENNDRKNCGFDVTCPHCDHTFVPCRHQPQCIPRTRALKRKTSE